MMIKVLTICILLLTTPCLGADGDYIIRRNNANTDSVPDNGSGDLDLLWDTAVDSSGSISYSGPEFVLGETGRFLVMASSHIGSSSTSNDRRSWYQRIVLNATALNEGMESAYTRQNSTGADEYITQSIAYVNVTSTTGDDDELYLEVEREDNVTDSAVDRKGNTYGGISIIKLDDSWNFAHYQSSSATSPGVDDSRTVMNIGSTVEEDGTVFSRSSNVVTVDTSNPVLVMWTIYLDHATGESGRSEYQGVLNFDSSELTRGINQVYGPRSAGAPAASMTGATILYPDDSGQALDLRIIAREDPDEDFNAELQLIELPSGSETATVERTTAAGNVNANGTDFAWQAAVQVDSSAFTYSAGNANIDVDNADDYLAFADIGEMDDAGCSGVRAVSNVHFRVNTTDITHSGGSSYNRQSVTADHQYVFSATLLTGLSASDSIYSRNTRIGTVTTSCTATGGFSIIRLSSLFPVADTSYHAVVVGGE